MTGYVSLNPLQYSNLEEALQNSHAIVDFEATSPTTGVIETKDVTIDYAYDTTRQVLNFTLGAKHSLAAKIAGDNVIVQHITELIFNMPGLNKAAPVLAPEPVPTAVDVVPQSNIIPVVEPVPSVSDTPPAEA